MKFKYLPLYQKIAFFFIILDSAYCAYIKDWIHLTVGLTLITILTWVYWCIKLEYERSEIEDDIE